MSHFKHDAKVIDFGAAAADTPPEAPKAPKAPKEPKAAAPPPKAVGKKAGADEKGITYTKADNFPKWYEQVPR